MRTTACATSPCTGWPIPGCEIRVVDAHMNDVPRDMQTIGEIVIRGDNVMDGYYKEPEATAAVMTGAWLHTGDMAVWDDETYIHIVDRKKDIIISGGENISSIEVERAIFAHPAVLECAVVAAPDPQWGEVPAAYVVIKPGSSFTERELCDFLQARIAKFKMPRHFDSAPSRCRKPAPARSLSASCAKSSGKAKIGGFRDSRSGTIDPICGNKTTPRVAGSLALSALVAAVPIVVLLFLLAVARKPAWMASLARVGRRRRRGRGGLRHAARPAGRRPSPTARRSACSPSAGWSSPPSCSTASRVESGKFEILKDSIANLTGDRRLQALLIAFAFGAFIEGAAGFGTPVAVAGAMLAGLGFTPFYAAAICLLANTAPVAFGSIAIPITTLAVTTGLPLDRLSAGVGRICAPVSLFVPGLSDSGDGRLERPARRLPGGRRVRHRLRRHAVRRFQLRRPATHRYLASLAAMGR